MATHAIPATARAGRAGQAERALWAHHGLDPDERFVDVAGTRLRVVAAGSGDPLLLVHGTGGPGTWPSLMAALPGRHCLALDRPGWAESAPVDWRGRDYGAFVADLLAGVLDALGSSAPTSPAPRSATRGRCGWPPGTRSGSAGSC